MRYRLATTPKTVIFLHIPKTAGTTLDQIIYRQYRNSEVYGTGIIGEEGVKRYREMSEAERRQYRLIKGHMRIGIHKYAPPTYAYFTFLRRPIERTLSHYYYIVRAPAHPLYDLIHRENISLRQCLEYKLDPMLYNAQTRLLGGVWTEIRPGECTQDHLEKAKENLRKQIRVIGLTEQFDASLLLLGKAFGWKNLYYTQQNVTNNRPTQETLSPETIGAVKNANQLDLELYDYARTLFEEQVRQQGPDFIWRVKQFQLKNRFIGRYIDLYWRMRKVSVRVFVRDQLKRFQ